MFWRKPKVDIAEKIREAVREVQEKAIEENGNLRLNVRNLQTQLNQRDTELNTLKSKLREQNEADILLTIKRIEARILQGETKQQLTDDLNRLAMLQQQSFLYQRGGLAESIFGRGLF